MTYNPNILRDVLRARSLSRAQLSQRLDIERAELERELDRDPGPRQGILNDIAKELALPPFVFFMRRLPPLHDVLPDFRSEEPSPAAKLRGTIESIQLAEAIQKTITDSEVGGVFDLPRFPNTEDLRRVDEFASRARSFFDITLEDQLTAKDDGAFYTVCRKKLEDKGIFVIHESFPESDGSGFCLAHGEHPIIVVNTRRQTRGRRLFTLMHELAHVLMGKSGISDPFVRRNSIEKLCNRFAGSFLVPASFVSALLKGATLTRHPDPDDVRWASRQLKISQQAAVLRLEQLRLYAPGSHQKWKKLVAGNNPDFGRKGGGGNSPPPQEKVKLAKYGFRFASVFGELLERGYISELNLFRSSGLKPQYQRPYFAYANSIGRDELRSLELDDE